MTSVTLKRSLKRCSGRADAAARAGQTQNNVIGADDTGTGNAGGAAASAATVDVVCAEYPKLAST